MQCQYNGQGTESQPVSTNVGVYELDTESSGLEICRSLLRFWKKRIAEKRAYRIGKDAEAGGGWRGGLHIHQIGEQSVERHVGILNIVRCLKERGISMCFENEKLDSMNPEAEAYITLACAVAQVVFMMKMLYGTW